MSATLECIGGPLGGKEFTVYAGTTPFTVDVHAYDIEGDAPSDGSARDFVALWSTPPFDASRRLGIYRADFRMWHLVWEPL